MRIYPPERSGILIMKVIIKYSYPPTLSGILIIFLIDSLQKHNEVLPSGAIRDFDYENHNEIQLPSDAIRDLIILYIDSLHKT